MNSNDLLLNDVIRCRQCDQMGQIIFLHLCPFKYSKICNFLSWQGQTFSQYKITPPPKKKLHHSTVWTFFALICCRNCNVCWKKTENKRKRGWGWSILKIITKWAACKLPGRTHLRRTSGVRQCCLPWRWPYRLRGSETGGTKCYAWPAKRSW